MANDTPPDDGIPGMEHMGGGPSMTPRSNPQPEPSWGEPSQGGPSDGHETTNIGLKDAFLEQKSYQPSPHVLQYFMTLDPDPSTAWIAGGPPLEAGFTMLRVLSDFTYVRFGVANIPNLILDSLKIWAGHDRKAREEGKEVATGVRVLPGLSLADEVRGAQREVSGRVEKG